MAVDLTEGLLYTFLPILIALLGFLMCRTCRIESSQEDESAPEPKSVAEQEDPLPVIICINPVGSDDSRHDVENPSAPE